MRRGGRVRYRRIHLIGGPGSGKSYIAAKIAATYGIAAHDLDDLFWDARAPTYGTRADKDQRNQALLALAARDSWIIEGAYYRWVAPSFARADLIIVLTPSVWRRDWRIMKRFMLRAVGRAHAKKTETLASQWGLIVWNHTYERTQLAPARSLIEGLGKSVVACSSLADVFQVLEQGDGMQHEVDGHPQTLGVPVEQQWQHDGQRQEEQRPDER
jgi:adenylate kinase family enzyme